MEKFALTNSESFWKSMRNKRTKAAEEEERDDDDIDYDTETEGCDVKVWNSFCESFRQVQSLLERNRSLIQQVNDNHQSRISDNLVENVSLIREINGNVSHAITIYSDLSSNFLNAIQQRRAMESKSKSKSNSENRN